MARVIAMLAGAAILWAASAAIMKAPCWSLVFIVAAVAWPIWRYQTEYALFARRAVLARVTHEDSRARRWLWTGRLTRVWHVLAAMAWAVVVLALAYLLDAPHWIALGADAVFLACIAGPVTRRMAGDVPEARLGLVARRWPLPALNFGVLALAFFAIDFFTGVADTRGLAWHAVAEQSFAKASGGAACPVAGAVIGALAAVQALTWHALQIVIPSLPNQGWKIVAWALVLLQAGIVAYAVTRLYLGLAAALDPGEHASSRDFVATAIVVGGVYVLALLALRGFDPAGLAQRGREAVAWADPCRSDARTVGVLKADLQARLQKARVDEQQQASERVEATVNALYADVEKGVDQYLDWYFTVIGEYQRLAALVTGRFAEQMRTELESRIFGDAFGGRLEQASRELAVQSQARLVALGAEMGTQVRGEASRPCGAGKFDVAALGSLERDALRATTAAGGGAAAGILTARFLARRAAAAAAARASSKRVFQGAATLAGRVAAKRTGSTLVAAAGGAAVCGPFAPLCALVAAGATWIALDKAFIEIDELVFRDEMRAEILAAIAEQKASLTEALSLQHHAEIDRTVAAIGNSMERVFVPARDGV